MSLLDFYWFELYCLTLTLCTFKNVCYSVILSRYKYKIVCPNIGWLLVHACYLMLHTRFYDSNNICFTVDGVDIYLGQFFSTNIWRVYLPRLGCRTWVVHGSHNSDPYPTHGVNQDNWVDRLIPSGISIRGIFNRT